MLGSNRTSAKNIDRTKKRTGGAQKNHLQFIKKISFLGKEKTQKTQMKIVKDNLKI
jgi:hypothetical protein